LLRKDWSVLKGASMSRNDIRWLKYVPYTMHKLHPWYALWFFTFNIKYLAGASQITWLILNFNIFSLISRPLDMISLISVINGFKNSKLDVGYLNFPWYSPTGITVFNKLGTYTKDSSIGQKLDLELNESGTPSMLKLSWTVQLFSKCSICGVKNFNYIHLTPRWTLEE